MVFGVDVVFVSLLLLLLCVVVVVVDVELKPSRSFSKVSRGTLHPHPLNFMKNFN